MNKLITYLAFCGIITGSATHDRSFSKQNEDPVEKVTEKFQSNDDNQSNDIYCSVNSFENSDHSGEFTIPIFIEASDTFQIFSDSIQITDSTYFSQSEITVNSSSFLPGDTSTIYIKIVYDSSNLPYAPEPISILINGMNADSSTLSADATAIVYFTNYGSTEVWDQEDFADLPRTWILDTSANPTKPYIHKDSIPASTRPSEEAITEEWQYDFQLKFIPGLPYAIQMAAVHPDTVAAYIYRDSTETVDPNDTSGFQYYKKSIRILPKRFTGTVSGRVVVPTVNDNNQPFNLFPRGLKVNLKERDDLHNRTIGYNYTDAQGNFTITYDIWQSPLEGESIELFLEFETESSNEFNYKVKIGLQTVRQLFNIGEALGTFSVDLGDLEFEGMSGWGMSIFHWTGNGYRFVKEQLGPNQINTGLLVRMFKGGSNFSSVLGDLIRLNARGCNHETVILHEFGHFVMHCLKPSNYTNGENCAMSKEHTSARENNAYLAFSEGWATAFMAMVDQYYRNEDNEYGNYSFSQGGNRLLNGAFPVERRNRSRLNGNGTGNGLLSEYHISCALYDLYDGPDKFLSTDPSGEWSDESGTTTTQNTFLVGDAFSNGTDKASLSFFIITYPFRQQKILTIDEYYFHLIAYLRSLSVPCHSIADVSEVFRENRISTDVRDDFYQSTSFGTDEISNTTPITFESNGSCGILIPFNETITFNPDIIELIGNDLSYNLGSGTSSSTKWISDPLTIGANATLWINEDQEMGFVNSGNSSPQSGSTLFAKVCNRDLIIEENGTLQVGSSDFDNIGIVTIEPYTTLTIRSGGTLLVNHNSSLIISEHANLVFEDGAIIDLNGTNAKLEIKGKLTLGSNAQFETTGDGILRFNMQEDFSSSTQYNIITTGNNCSVNITSKTIEVGSGTYVYPMDNLAMFTLYGSTVNMETGAFFNLGCQVTLQSSIFQRASGIMDQYAHHGIKLYGQHVDGEGRAVVNNCSFTNAKYGIRAYQNNGGNSTKITNSFFTTCYYAVSIYDKGAYLYANQFDNCQNAINADMTTNYFNVESNVIRNSVGYGLRSLSQQGSKYILGGNVFRDNYSAMYLNRPTAYLRCNAIYRNFMSAFVENNTFYRVNRMLFTRFWYEQGGDNLFQEFNGPTYLGNWSYFNGNSRYSFSAGFNQFTRLNPSSPNFTISATLDRNSNTAHPLDLAFGDNFWAPAINPSSSNFLSVNPSTSNANFRISINQASNQPNFVYGTELTNLPGCPITEWTGAITNMDTYYPGSIPGILFKKQPDEGLLGSTLLENPTAIIPGGTHSGTGMENTARDLLSDMHLGYNYDKDSIDIVELYDLGNLLLSIIGQISSQDDEEYLYDEYMSAFNSAYSDGLINSNNLSTYLTQAESIIDAKLDVVDEWYYSAPSAYYSYRFTYNMDKAYLYRSVGEYQDAINALAYVAGFASDKDMILVDGVTCFVNQEKDLSESTINQFQFGNEITNCSFVLDSALTEELDPLDSMTLSSSEDDLTITLSPNPTTTNLNLQLDIEISAYVEVKIYTKTGFLLNTDPVGNIISGTYYRTYDVSGYIPDVYILIVFVDGAPYSENFIVGVGSGN